jgi:hypothetical protein
MVSPCLCVCAIDCPAPNNIKMVVLKISEVCTTLALRNKSF